MTQRVNQKDSNKAVSQPVVSSTTSTTTTYYGTRTQACSREEALIADYEQSIGPFDAKAQWLLMRYAAKMDFEVLDHAIDVTGWAPRPSKQYLAAILRRYDALGITTMEDVMRDEDEHEKRRASDLRRRHARWYDDQSGLTWYDHCQNDPRLDESWFND